MDVDVMGVSVRAENGWRGALGHSKNATKAPKFGKVVKFRNGKIFGALVPYLLVYLF
jgi:hypothetical protein